MRDGRTVKTQTSWRRPHASILATRCPGSGIHVRVQRVLERWRHALAGRQRESRRGEPRRARAHPRELIQRLRPDQHLGNRRPVGLAGERRGGDRPDQAILDAFEAKYPNITLDYQPIATDYPTAMAAKFSAGEPPDLFYVDSSVAQDWIDQGVLQDLDAMAAERGFDTSQFFEGYLDAFKGPDGKTYGFPKDGNTLAMAYNTELLTAAGIEPPTTWDELKTAAEKLTAGGKKAFCLNHSLDRALAFVYQEGGSLLSEDKTENTIDSPEVKDALQTYLGFFKNGQGIPRRRPRRRLVRQGPRRGTGGDHLRGRLARSVHEDRTTRT